MLKTGAEHLESIRDGRKVYVGNEEVTDVTTHPAFRNAAKSFAMLYDKKRDPENIDVMSYEEDGERYTSWYLMPKTRDDLRKRAETHRRIAKWTCGLLGRSPRPRRVVRLGSRDEAGAVRGQPQGLRRQPGGLLGRHAQERHLRLLHRAAPAGRAQAGALPARRADRADAARHQGDRQGRRAQRHEDARHLGRLLQRDLGRQPAPARARPGQGVDHLRRPPRAGGRQDLVAQAVRAPRGVRVRQPAVLEVRRDRTRWSSSRTSRCRGSACSRTTTRP